MNQEVSLPRADQLLNNLRQQKTKIMEESLRRLQDLKASVARSHEVLAGVQTFSLFPDEVIVDRTKVTIIKRRGFWSTDVISIQIEDVLNVSSTVGLIFGSLTIASRVMSTTDHYYVTMLWRQDAIDLKHIIQGYTIAKHDGFDMNDLPREAVIETLRELGHDSGA
jgi:predicted nuclease of restriction endonuclease-like RecB superfamily